MGSTPRRQGEGRTATRPARSGRTATQAEAGAREDQVADDREVALALVDVGGGDDLAEAGRDDDRAAAAAERGRGSAYVMPAVCAVATFAVLIFAWGQQSISVQSAILSIGWPVLYLVTVLQTLFMVKKLLRRQRGFTV